MSESLDSEASWETTSSTRDMDMDQGLDGDFDDMLETGSGSSYFGSEFGGGPMCCTFGRRHHRAESDDNSSNTDYEPNDGYYDVDWVVPEDEAAQEEARVPEPPRFRKFKPLNPKHKHKTGNIPEGFGGDDFKDPLKIFQLFITDETFAALAAATNAYAVKRLGDEAAKWRPTTAGEIKVFFGIILYMGIFRAPDVEDYWRTDGMCPLYAVRKYMTELRFRLLLQFFHTGPPEIDDDGDWHGQLEPLGAKIREASMRYYLPGVEMSLDRTKDLNIFSLNHYSYTWNFLFHKDPPINVPIGDLDIEGLSFPVSTTAYLLASALPKESYRFTIVANKHFTNVPLFSALRRIGIGAVGEATWNREGFPESLQDLEDKYIPWGTVTGALCGPDEDVLAIVWRHFATIRMLTTIHEITPVNRNNYGKSESYKNPCPPRDQPIVDAAFGGQKYAMIEQPRAALELSDYMDNTQNLFTKTPRDTFWTRQLPREPVVQKRQWLMGLVWLLDVAVVNANVVSKQCGGKRDHTKFRIDVATGLLHGMGDPPQSSDFFHFYEQGEPSLKRARVD